MSTLFFDSSNPLVTTAEIRVFSAAMHAVCCLAAAGQDKYIGKADDTVIRAFWNRLAGELLKLYPNSGDALFEVMEVAKAHGLYLNPNLDPDICDEVIQ